MTTNLVPLADIERIGTIIAQSGLFGAKKPQEAIALCLLAQAFGMHPAMAAQDFDIIQGRPAKKSDAMLRTFIENNGKVEWHKLDDTIADATFSHPSGGSLRITWDMNRAKQAGLGGKDMWRKFPRQMLRARCVSEGVRSVYPAATAGTYVPEEVMDFAEKDVTPAAPDAKPTPAPEAIRAKAAAMKADSAKAAKANKPVASVIEGQATHIADPGLPPEAGDLSDIVSNVPDKPTEEQLGRVVHAFAKIGFTIEMLEAEYGKRIDEWTMTDMDEAREVFKIKKAEHDAAQSTQEEI